MLVQSMSFKTSDLQSSLHIYLQILLDVGHFVEVIFFFPCKNPDFTFLAEDTLDCSLSFHSVT